MAVDADEAIYELEKALGKNLNTDLDAAKLERMQASLEDVPLRQIIELIERQSSSRGAVLLRLLPPQRATAVFDALDPAHQADLVEALSDESVTSLFAALGAEDRVQLLDNLPAEIADQVMSGLDEEERERRVQAGDDGELAELAAAVLVRVGKLHGEPPLS